MWFSFLILLLFGTPLMLAGILYVLLSRHEWLKDFRIDDSDDIV